MKLKKKHSFKETYTYVNTLTHYAHQLLCKMSKLVKLDPNQDERL